MREPISYESAIAVIREETPGPTSAIQVPLDQAAGHILAADVCSDLNIPPFRKAMMDGFAVRCEDLLTPNTRLDVVARISAGATPTTALVPGTAAEVMTGAPLPTGADAVVMVEKSSGFGAKTVTIQTVPTIGDHVAEPGEILKHGERVLKRGTLIGLDEVALLATIGCDPTPVFAMPTVAALTTGDELVPPSARPGPAQIRDTNGVLLRTFLKKRGIAPVCLGVAADRLDDIREKVSAGLKADLLLVSGGVSMGAFDFVQDVLRSLGVTIHFGKVALKPGKPTVFGTLDRAGKRHLVMGLPGNPVSTSVMAQLLVGCALDKLMGNPNSPRIVHAVLAKPIRKKANRLWFVPGRLVIGPQTDVIPIPTRGSADVFSVLESNCLIVAPKDTSRLDPGETVRVILKETALT